MAKRRNRGRGQYRYTAKRATALKRAQAISARKRKGRRRAITQGVIAGATLAGVGAAAVYGYKNRSTIGSDIRSTKNRWRNAVQPGSKERVRIANAIGGNLIKKPTKKKAATKGAKTFSRTQIAAVHPDVVDPTRNNAFPKAQRDVDVANKLIAGSDRGYNVDKFLPKGVKGMVFGKNVSGAAGARAVAEHAKAKGAITGKDVDAAGILHGMLADGGVNRVVYGKKARRKAKVTGDALLRPRNSRAGRTKNPAPKETMESKAFDQWIKDFE